MFEWKKLIDLFAQKGCQSICLTGGEPLLYEGLSELIAHIKEKGIICDLTTNGLLVPEKIKILEKVDTVMVSLDGREEEHNANRQRWAKVIEALDWLKEEEIPVRINAIMTKQSFNGDNIDWLLSLGVPVIFSLPVEFPKSFKSLEDEILLPDGHVKLLFMLLKKKKKEGKPVLFSLEAIDYIIHYPHPYRGAIVRGNYYERPCPFGQQMVYVDANGDLYPCATLWNSQLFEPKNIRTNYDEAWENMKDLPCKYCSCIALPEWDRFTSPRGIIDGIKLTTKHKRLQMN